MLVWPCGDVTNVSLFHSWTLVIDHLINMLMANQSTLMMSVLLMPISRTVVKPSTLEPVYHMPNSVMIPTQAIKLMVKCPNGSHRVDGVALLAPMLLVTSMQKTQV